MKTWGDLKNEVLGLMFSNNIGGIEVSTSDARVQEYIINMPDAANAAFRELASVCPVRKSVAITTFSDKKEFDMLKLCEDFMVFEDDGVYFTGGDTAQKADNYFIRGGSKITFTGDRYGNYEIGYLAYPKAVTRDTAEEYVPELSQAALDAAAYYMASRLYAEDDMSLAAYYMNVYENRKAVLEKLYITSAGRMGGKFVSERGWY